MEEEESESEESAGATHTTLFVVIMRAGTRVCSLNKQDRAPIKELLVSSP
jgi:hypothetical protein